LSFWEFDDVHLENIALIDANSNITYSYQDLNNISSSIAEKFNDDRKKLSFIFCDNSASNIAIYISQLHCKNAIYLADVKMDSSLKNNLISIYQPDYIFDTTDNILGYRSENILDHYFLHKNLAPNLINIYDETAVLLSTSGTTGSPKLVRLSYKNIMANASSIAEYLNIDMHDRAITSLPISYSYGLSVLNSHLLAGASIICTNKSIVVKDFWNIFKEHKCTSFAGVPYMYQTLQKLRFHTMNLPSLKTMTQAGGRLSEEFIKYFYNVAKEKNIRLFIMYGQTEATARISYVPHLMLENKIGSIGVSIPNGKLALENNSVEITEPHVEAELIYTGDNVMLGYASSNTDLERGDELKGILRTGDIAKFDSDGYFYITGRTKRFLKIFGLRLNLDEVEKMIENNFHLPNACFGNDDFLTVLIESVDVDSVDKVKHKIIDIYKLHHSVLRVISTDKIPVTSSGKKDYLMIKEFSANVSNR
jgi:acyl-coenzyme A synthetase/AMP-(fatty) acid ligase